MKSVRRLSDLETAGVLLGENDCKLCGSHINWQATIKCQTVQSPNAAAEAIAVERINTTEGVSVVFEIFVTCIECGVKNKFSKTVNRI